MSIITKALLNLSLILICQPYVYAAIPSEQIHTARITPSREKTKELGNKFMQQAFKLERTLSYQLPKIITVHSNPRLRLPSTVPYNQQAICTKDIPKSTVFSMPQTGPLQLQGIPIPLQIARADLGKKLPINTCSCLCRKSSPKRSILP